MLCKRLLVMVIFLLFLGVGIGSAADLAVSKQQALAFIQQKDAANAEQAIAQVKAACVSNPAVFSQVVVELSEAWEQNQNRDRGHVLRRELIQKYPDDEAAKVLADFFTALEKINQGDDAAAEALVDKIYPVCVKNATLRWRLVRIADRWDLRDRLSFANALRQRIVQDFPGTPVARTSGLYLLTRQIQAQIWAGQDAEALAGLSQLQATYADLTGEMPWRLWEIACIWKECGRQKDLVLKLKKDIATRYPSETIAVDAGLELARDEISQFLDQGELDKAHEVLARMEKDYAAQPELLAKRLLEIANRFEEKGEAADGMELRQLILNEYAGTKAAQGADLVLDRAEVCRLMGLGQFDQAAQKLSAMQSQHAKEDGLPWHLLDMASLFEGNGKKDHARGIYLNLLAGYPNHAATAKAMGELFGVSPAIRQGKLDDAQAKIALVKQDTPPDLLTMALFFIAEEYYVTGLSHQTQADFPTKTYLQNTIAMLEKEVLSGYVPVTGMRREGRFILADSKRIIGDAAGAIAAYQAALAEFPGDRAAWHAQYMIGQLQEKLGGTSPAAKAQVKTAYETLLAKYPDCPVAAYVKGRLAQK